MITDFLGMELNLNDISYMLYTKQNTNIMNINKISSHPKNIIKQTPSIINDRLNKTSSTEESFLKVKSDYESIMENAVIKKNFTTKLWTKPSKPKKRNIIWYNPSFNNKYWQKIHKFSKKKHFNRCNPLSKILLVRFISY